MAIVGVCCRLLLAGAEDVKLDDHFTSVPMEVLSDPSPHFDGHVCSCLAQMKRNEGLPEVPKDSIAAINICCVLGSARGKICLCRAARRTFSGSWFRHVQNLEMEDQLCPANGYNTRAELLTQPTSSMFCGVHKRCCPPISTKSQAAARSLLLAGRTRRRHRARLHGVDGSSR